MTENSGEGFIALHNRVAIASFREYIVRMGFSTAEVL